LSVHYKNRVSDSDYDNRLDLTVNTNGVFIPNPGYSAFIRQRKIEGDETQLRLVLHPISWLKATFTYRLVATDYSTTTDPVPGGSSPQGLLAGRYSAHVYGLNATLTPFPRFYFSGTFSYSDSRTETGLKGTSAIVPYQGHAYDLIASASYILNQASDLHAAYSFSHAGYGQNNLADGLPLGLDYTRHGLMVGITRRLSSHLTTNLRYGFYQYSEPASGGVNNYEAHGIFATLAFKWP